MPDRVAQDQQDVLPYATPAARPVEQSGYALASLVVAGLSLAWFALAFTSGLPFDPRKQHRIGSVASVLAIILAIGAYRQPYRKHALKHVAMTIAGCAFMLYVLIVPL
jgi:hypothetical protein